MGETLVLRVRDGELEGQGQWAYACIVAIEKRLRS